jgi:hypothetical protein
MAVNLLEKDTDRPLATITDEQFRFLVDELEEESPTDTDYYLDVATLIPCWSACCDNCSADATDSRFAGSGPEPGRPVGRGRPVTSASARGARLTNRRTTSWSLPRGRGLEAPPRLRCPRHEHGLPAAGRVPECTVVLPLLEAVHSGRRRQPAARGGHPDVCDGGRYATVAARQWGRQHHVMPCGICQTLPRPQMPLTNCRMCDTPSGRHVPRAR